MLAELDYDNAEKCFYTRGDELISQERDGKKSYYVYDGHGTVLYVHLLTKAVRLRISMYTMRLVILSAALAVRKMTSSLQASSLTP